MKIIHFLFLIFILLITGSCSLEEDPKGLVVPQQFYQSKTEINQAMNGAYVPLNNYDFYGQSWWNRAEAINDQVTCRENLRPGFTYDNPGDGFPLLWKLIYEGINSANVLIKGINESPELDETTRVNYLAEARFIRGLYYFHAVVGYGDVPLVLETTSTTEALEMGRTESGLVWDQIIDDLLFASENGVDDFGDVKSRGSKWTAMAFLSRVYLYNNRFSEAADIAKKVVASGKYDLMPSFSDVFLEENERGAEVIFSVEYLPNVFTSSHASFFTARADYESSTTPGVIWNGWGSNRVSSLLPDMFEAGDLRKDQTVINTNFLDENKPFVVDEWQFGPKFHDFNNPRAASAKDFKIMRYAELLLNYAEAENEANGPTTEAYDALNKIRLRAGLEVFSDLSQEQFRQAVRQERTVELVGEGHRKWDLVRWGIWLDTMKSLPEYDIPAIGKANITSRFELFPVPDVEIAKNPNLLPNNPGY